MLSPQLQIRIDTHKLLFLKVTPNGVQKETALGKAKALPKRVVGKVPEGEHWKKGRTPSRKTSFFVDHDQV